MPFFIDARQIQVGFFVSRRNVQDLSQHLFGFTAASLREIDIGQIVEI